MKDLLIMAKSLGGGGSEVALIELINALPEAHYNITLVSVSYTHLDRRQRNHCKGSAAGDREYPYG